MNIQIGYGVPSYQGTHRIDMSKSGTATTKSTLSNALGAENLSSSATRVSISDAARKLATQESTVTQGRTAIQEKLLNSAASDPQSAEKLAYDIASTPSTIFYDISDQLASGKMAPLNKLSSGRIIDDAFKENFSRQAAVIDAQRKSIYDAEKARGTPADEILAKLFDHTNSQSKDYLEATAWLESVGGKTA